MAISLAILWLIMTVLSFVFLWITNGLSEFNRPINMKTTTMALLSVLFAPILGVISIIFLTMMLYSAWKYRAR